MGGKKRPSVRQLITIALVYTATLVLVQSVAVVLLTDTLHGANTTLINSLVSVRAMRQAQINLLVRDRATDAVVRATIENRIRRDLTFLESTDVLPPDLFAEAERQVNAYLEAPNADVVVPFQTLGRLIDMRMVEANEARARVDKWDSVARMLSMAVAVLAVLGLAVVTYWSSQAFVRPLSTLADAVRRFGRGDERARAPHATVRELDDIGEEFNEMSETLLRRRETMLQYVASVAHDLRNPITTLRLSASAIRDDQPLPDEKRVRQTLSLIQRQIARLERMVDDLFDRARIEAGHFDLQKEDNDAVALAASVVSLFDGASSIHTLTLHTSNGPIPLRGDPTRIEQALTNLVSNAIKYSPGGGPISVTVERHGANVTYEVEDHGLGIPAEEVPLIWEPFRRAGSERVFIPGAGLGLPMVRRIVEAHGGEVSVESTRGEGSLFRITLPCDGVGDGPPARKGARDASLSVH